MSSITPLFRSDGTLNLEAIENYSGNAFSLLPLLGRSIPPSLLDRIPPHLRVETLLYLVKKSELNLIVNALKTWKLDLGIAAKRKLFLRIVTICINLDEVGLVHYYLGVENSNWLVGFPIVPMAVKFFLERFPDQVPWRKRLILFWAVDGRHLNIVEKLISSPDLTPRDWGKVLFELTDLPIRSLIQLQISELIYDRIPYFNLPKGILRKDFLIQHIHPVRSEVLLDKRRLLRITPEEWNQSLINAIWETCPDPGKSHQFHSRYYPVVQRLIQETPANPSLNQNQLLIQSAERGDFRTVQILLSDPRVRSPYSESLTTQSR